jgi:hypothetical protein
MAFSDLITILGVVVTIGGAIVSIVMAKKAADSANIAMVARVIDRMVVAQEHIRNLAPNKIKARASTSEEVLMAFKRNLMGRSAILQPLVHKGK